MLPIRDVRTLILLIFVVTDLTYCSDDKAVSFAKLATCKEYDISSRQCQHYFPLSELKNYKSDMYKLYLKFYVMASKDANIVLTNGKTGGEKIEYIAVISGYANTYSWLRTNETTIGLDSHKPGILSPLWPVPIVVKQNYCGDIEVAIPGVLDPILKGPARDLETKSVCVYSWDSASRWFYNCDENIDVMMREPSSCTKNNPRPGSYCRCDSSN